MNVFKSLRRIFDSNWHWRRYGHPGMRRTFTPERKIFESWATHCGLSVEMPASGRYTDDDAFWAYEGWYGRFRPAQVAPAPGPPDENRNGGKYPLPTPEREEFEAWATQNGFSVERLVTGRYANNDTFWAYEGWYAQRLYRLYPEMACFGSASGSVALATSSSSPHRPASQRLRSSPNMSRSSH